MAVWVPGRLIEAAQVQVHGRQVIYFTSGLVSHGWERRSSPRSTNPPSWEEEGRNLFHKEALGCDWSRAAFPVFSPHSMLPSLANRTSDGTQSHDRRRSMAPREYTVYAHVCVCECWLCLSQPLEGRDPGYVVDVHSGQGPDRT